MNKVASMTVVFAGWFLGAASVIAGPVDINSADAVTLADELTGIGPSLAAEIVRDRDANGRYESADELTRVKGVGTRIVEMNRDNIVVSPVPTGK
jgi:competence protein ComEA